MDYRNCAVARMKLLNDLGIEAFSRAGQKAGGDFDFLFAGRGRLLVRDTKILGIVRGGIR